MSLFIDNEENLPLPDSFLILGKTTDLEPSINRSRYWSLQQSSGHTPALILETKIQNSGGDFGVFPRYREHNRITTNPKSFPVQPHVKGYSGDWIEFNYSPLDGIHVDSLYWAVEPDAFCGELVILNQGNLNRKISLDLIFTLNLSSGKNLIDFVYQGKNLLYGLAEDQHIICFVSGEPSHDAGSSTLRSHLTFEPGSEYKLRWIFIQANSKESGLDKLKRLILINLKDEISRKKITLQDQLTISTGNLDWDFALKYSQIQAENFLALIQLQSPGVDNYKITPLEGLQLIQSTHPINQQKIQSILDLVFQDNNKEKISIAGSPEYPFYGELLWQIYQISDLGAQADLFYQQAIFYLNMWFGEELDQDGDAIPEITPLYFFNSLADSLPYPLHLEKNIGINPHLESPGLSSLLVNEINKLSDLSQTIGSSTNITSIEKTRSHLIKHIKSSWSPESTIYRSRDSVSHLTLEGQTLREEVENGLTRMAIPLPDPTRIGISLKMDQKLPTTPDPELVIHGRDHDGRYRIETISASQILWNQGKGWSYSQIIYSHLDYIFLQVSGDIEVNVFVPGSPPDDISQLFPLFSKIPEQERAEILVNGSVINPDKFWSPIGICNILKPGKKSIHLPWNYLVIQGLINYGMKSIAADLFSRIMSAVELNIRTTGNISGIFDTTTRKGLGPQLAIEGLISIKLLLDIAGIRFATERELIIEGEYPFKFPLRLNYRGAEIIRNREITSISIPGKEKIIYSDSGEHRVVIN